MRKLYSLYVVLVGLMVMGISYGVYHYKQEEKQALLQSFLRQRAQFSQHLQQLAQSTLSFSQYTASIKLLIEDYMTQLKDLQKQAPDLFNEQLAETQYQQKNSKKAPSFEQQQLHQEYLELTRKVYQQFKERTYTPVLSFQKDHARLDILSLKKEKTGNRDVLVAEFMAVGLSEKTAFNGIEIKGYVKNQVKYQFNAPAARPIIDITHPDHFIHTFIPDVRLGYFYLQPVPRDTEEFDLKIDLTLMDSPAPQPVSFILEKTPVSELWKLPEGVKLDTTVIEASKAEREHGIAP